ncbi:MAG: hemolysin D [Pirellulales bacterium]|nr:hemolysin D [Pirellulales bacterium]
MATLADSLVSSSARKLPVRMRPDLSARRQRYLGRSYWVVKDPVGLHYFRFQEEEYAILQMLDGQKSLDEVKDQFEAEFPPQKITLEELQQFLGMLHRSGLVIVAVPGQGHQLCKRRDERRRKEILGALSNVLCIRFKGFDPERFLNWLYPAVKWFFHPVMMVTCMLFGLSALMLVLAEFDVFRSKLPDFYQFFSVHNAFWLAIVLGLTKVLHEFGHGLSCKHFGGECHEMGVMILVLTPCLYCNVSDSWMLPSKWQRAFIGAAGMYVEIVLASIATYVWWFTQPGLLNNLALNTMFISSVSTVLFNANPLLRYDGYYILADLTEIPNLRQKATTILSRKMGEWFLGLEQPDDPFLPERNQIFFALYSVAAAVYRWVVVLSILYFLYKIFEPYGLKVIGQAIVAMSMYGLFIQPLYRLGKFFYVPGRWDKVKKPRMYAALAGLAVIALLVVFLPLPYSVMSTLEIQARDAASVYIDVPGRLDEVLVQPGEAVRAKKPLARLSNVDVELKIAELASSVDEYKARLATLEGIRYEDRTAFNEIRQVEEALANVEKQLKEQQEDQQRMTLVAPIAGNVLPPPWKPNQKDAGGQLGAWTGTPLEAQNLGCFLEEGSLFCQVGDPEQMEAILVVDQSDIDFVRKGQDVDIKLDELPHDLFLGSVAEIAKIDLEVASRRMTTKAGGELATRTDESGVERPMSTSYQVRVPLNDPDHLLRLGLRGRAKIHMGRGDWQTLGQRFWRFLSQTFNFRL